MTEHTNGAAPQLREHELEGLTWVDVAGPDPEVFEQLESRYKLHGLHLHESLQKVQPTKSQREADYIFVLLHLPEYDPKANKIISCQIGVFLGKDFVVTIHTGQTTIASRAYQRCVQNFTATKLPPADAPGYMLHCVLHELVREITDHSTAVLSELEEIEGLVFDDDESDAYRIGKVRQKIIRLRRIISPLRLTLHELAGQVNEFVGDGLNKQFTSDAKAVHKLWEVAQEAKEMIEVYKDADFTISTEKTNRILAILTLLFTLTIPATVIGSFYGMNVLLPGGIETGSWTFLGAYTMLKLVVAISAGFAIAMYLYFRRKRWF